MGHPHENAPVVVGTDLSNSADEAVRQAAAWAARVRAPLTVVHVAPETVFSRLETRKVIDALVARMEVLTEPFGVGTEVVLGAGSSHAEIVRIADERTARLVVVGASGAGAVGRAVFGSTAEQVARYAHCPVLVARPEGASGPVIAATDFSDPANSALQAAVEQARLRGVPVRLIHCLFDPPSPLSVLGPTVISEPVTPEAESEALRSLAEETLRTSLESIGVLGTCQALVGPPGPTIIGDAETSQASLVVVATHGRTGFVRMALGSVAELVVRRAPCSVLVVRRSLRET